MIQNIKKMVVEFAKKIDSMADERESKKTENNARYLPEVAAEENAKLQEEFEKAAEPIRARTIAQVENTIQKMKNFLVSGISHVDVKALEELQALSGVDLEDNEVEILKDAYRANYWALRVLADRVKKDDSTAEGILANAQSFKPEPEKYFAMFDEILETVKRIVGGYDGKASTTSTRQEAVASILLLRGTYFEDTESRINGINPAYFLTDYPKYNLTAEESEQLREFLGDVRENEIELRLHNLYSGGKIPADSEIYNLLTRSRYRKIFESVVASFHGEDPVALMGEIESDHKAKEEWEKKFSDMFK